MSANAPRTPFPGFVRVVESIEIIGKLAQTLPAPAPVPGEPELLRGISTRSR
ncbi:MAG: hypothetical protein ACREFP_21570 [Acetobacteraceae bacterium]